jgi:hypothetical protein
MAERKLSSLFAYRALVCRHAEKTFVQSETNRDYFQCSDTGSHGHLTWSALVWLQSSVAWLSSLWCYPMQWNGSTTFVLIAAWKTPQLPRGIHILNSHCREHILHTLFRDRRDASFSSPSSRIECYEPVPKFRNFKRVVSFTSGSSSVFVFFRITVIPRSRVVGGFETDDVGGDDVSRYRFCYKRSGNMGRVVLDSYFDQQKITRNLQNVWNMTDKWELKEEVLPSGMWYRVVLWKFTKFRKKLRPLSSG